MNKYLNGLFSIGKKSQSKSGKVVFPYTLYIDSNYKVIKRANGVGTFDTCPKADLINIIYSNGKTKVIKNKTNESHL